MSAAEARHIAAAVAFLLAKRELEGHDGPKRGPEFEAKVRDWRRALEAHAAAGLAVADEELERLEREEADAALQADRCDPVG